MLFRSIKSKRIGKSIELAAQLLDLAAGHLVMRRFSETKKAFSAFVEMAGDAHDFFKGPHQIYLIGVHIDNILRQHDPEYEKTEVR